MNRERRQIEGCNSSVSQEARPPCFVKQKLIGAREGSKAREGPLTALLTLELEGSVQKEYKKKKRFQRDTQKFCTVFHSTERDPQGAMMTRVIGFLQLW